MSGDTRGRRPRVAYLAVGHLSDNFVNSNLGQRVLMAPGEVDLSVVVPRRSRPPSSLPPNVELRPARLPGLWGFYIEAVIQLAVGSGRMADVVVTDRSAVSIIGWAMRGRSGYRWVVDLWDVPHKELIADYASRRGFRARLRRTASRAKVAALSTLLRRADLVLASVRGEALVPYRIDDDRLQLFSSGIDLRALPRLDEGEGMPGSICYVSSVFLPDRGVDVLLEAIELLDRDLEPAPTVTLVGSLPDDLRRRVEDSPVANRFELAGEWDISEAHALMGRSQVGVIPFHSNEDLDGTYPIKLYEYMALGCVVVASDLPGIRSIVGDDGSAAILVDPGDPAALARGLRSALTDPARRRALRSGARERVQHFDAREKTQRIYRALLEGPSRRPI